MHIRDATGCERSKNHQITESGKKSFLEFGINSDQLHPYWKQIKTFFCVLDNFSQGPIVNACEQQN